MDAMRERSVRRTTAFAGVAFVVLGLLSTVAPLAMPHPMTSATAKDVATYMTGERASLLAGMYMFGLGWCAVLLVFSTGLRHVLGKAEGEPAFLSTLGLVGGVAVAAVLLVLAAIFSTACFQTAADDPNGARVLYHELFILGNFSAFPTIANILPFSIVMIRTGAVGKGVGWIGVVASIAHAVASGALLLEGPMSPAGIIPALAPVCYLVWAGATSVKLFKAPAA